MNIYLFLYFYCSFEFNVYCVQGKFRLKRKQPKESIENGQSKASGGNSSQIEPSVSESSQSKQDQEEELPDLKDPEVQKATSLIQVIDIDDHLVHQ